VIPCLNEEENIGELIGSLHSQTYRPIEVVLVDDGSTDKTLRIVGKLQKKLTEKDFAIKVLHAEEFEGKRGPSKSRNIGVRMAKGEYIVLVDADWKFIDKRSVEKMMIGLRELPVANFLLKPIIDNDLEYNLALDANPKSLPTHDAFRRGVIEKAPFDQNLGFGEDWDFIARLKKQGLLQGVKSIDTEVGIHSPHTLKEYAEQKFWRGRTVWPLIKKYPKLIVIFPRLILPASSFGLLLMTILTAFVDVKISFVFMALFTAILIHLLLKSPKRSLGRAFHLIFIRMIFGSLLLTLGALCGFYLFFIKREFIPGRQA